MHMNMKLFGLELVAILVSCIIFTTPFVFATEVNVYFGGTVRATTEISPETLINVQMNIVHAPSDIAWTQTQVHVLASGSSMAHSLEKIYIYKCQNTNPTECARLEPIEFESFADTELAWSDISARGDGIYPQTANILLLAKLERDTRSVWVGELHTFERTAYNVFNHNDREISQIDVEASSLEFVEPITFYIENFQMIPFNWIERVTFTSATSLFALLGDGIELEASPPTIQTVHPTTNFVSALSNEFGLVLPETPGGISHPITLNLNPTFTCGNNMGEIELGESSTNCCLDVGCPLGQYCDIAAGDPASEGSCRQESTISLTVLPITIPSITECSEPVNRELRVKVQNPPSSLPESAIGVITLGDETQISTCRLTLDTYSCPFTITPTASCGSGSFSFSPNMVNLTVSYLDGSESVNRDLSATFPPIGIDFRCGCDDGMFCDASDHVCKSEGSISLGIVNSTSRIDEYNAAGDEITVTARIFNPPSDLTVTGVTYTLGNITFSGDSIPGVTGSPSCEGGIATGHVYTCTIPFSIPDYESENQYVIRQNEIAFNVQYSSVDLTMRNTIEAIFADVTIPSATCGDNIIQTEERTLGNYCCQDAGCEDYPLPVINPYCDAERSCRSLDDIALSLERVTPTPLSFENHRESHNVNFTLQVINPPSDAVITLFNLAANGGVQGWPLSCNPLNTFTGITECSVTIPPQLDCDLPFCEITRGELNITLQFTGSPIEIKELSVDLPSIRIVPTFQTGDGFCEPQLNESASNSCQDCACEFDPQFGNRFYCSVPPAVPGSTQQPAGRCLSTDDINLMIDSPIADVGFDLCEKAQDVEIIAHITNAPPGLTIENSMAILNGTTAERFRSCSMETGFGGNSSFKCTLTVPPDQECTIYKTNTYEPNSMSMFISFPSGQLRATKILTAGLPAITVSQGAVRSIRDIVSDLIEGSKETIEEIQDTLEDMIDIMRGCVYAAVIIGLSFVALSLGSLASPLFVEKIALPQAALASKDIAIAGGAAVGATVGICQLISTIHRLEIELLQNDLKMLEMQTCLELNQHQLDIGQCDGQEMSCFQSMTSCLERGLSGVQQTMDRSVSIISSMQGTSQQIAQNIAQFGESLGEAASQFSGGMGTVDPICVVEGQASASPVCCAVQQERLQRGVITPWYGRQINEGGYCPQSAIRFNILAGPSCGFPVIRDPVYNIEVCKGTANCEIGPLGTRYTSPTTATFQLYCFANQQAYISARGAFGEPADTLTMYIGYDANKDCGCDQSEYPAGSPAGLIPTSQRASLDTPAGEEASLIAAIDDGFARLTV